MVISKRFTMECAHVLPKHPGKCRQLHGHSYSVTVEVTGPVDAGTGFVLDYAVLGQFVKPFVDFLDHKFLNYFFEYPSAEFISIGLLDIIHRKITKRFGNDHMRVRVCVSETAATEAWADSHDASFRNRSKYTGWLFPMGNERWQATTDTVLQIETWRREWIELVKDAEETKEQ